MTEFDPMHDTGVRVAVFSWLRGLVPIHGEVLPLSVLKQGFVMGDERVRVIGLQGVFKPALMLNCDNGIQPFPSPTDWHRLV